MYDVTKVTDNYGDYGGNDWWVEGTLHVTGTIDLAGEDFKPAEHLDSTASAADIILALKVAGLMEKDEWVVDAGAVGTPSAMPTPETISNTNHISSIDFEDNTITVTLDCKVADLEDANHGTTWGVHKWLGFAVETSLSSIAGIVFTDSSGASATLGDGDISEATSLGIDAGGFVLYIKAEQLEYIYDGRYFTLEYPGIKKTKFTIKVVEPEE